MSSIYEDPSLDDDAASRITSNSLASSSRGSYLSVCLAVTLDSCLATLSTLLPNSWVYGTIAGGVNWLTRGMPGSDNVMPTNDTVSSHDKRADVHCPGAGSSRLSTVGLNSYFRSSRQSTASVAPAGPSVRRAMPKQAAHRRGSSLSGSSPDVLGGLIDTVGHTHALLEYPTRSPHCSVHDSGLSAWCHSPWYFSMLAVFASHRWRRSC